MAEKISYTQYRSRGIMKNATGITVFQYDPEAWKARQVIVSDVEDIIYVHERGQKKPSMLVLPQNWREDADSLKALFHRANIAGGWITVKEGETLTRFSYDKVQAMDAPVATAA